MKRKLVSQEPEAESDSIVLRTPKRVRSRLGNVGSNAIPELSSSKGAVKSTQKMTDLEGNEPNDFDTDVATPKSKSKRDYSTPVKRKRVDSIKLRGTPTANRSAQKKSVQKLLDSTLMADEDLLEVNENLLAQRILDDGEGESSASSDDDENGLETEPVPETGDDGLLPVDTPVKRGRGRPKGSKNKRLATPPPDLPPHERYFFQNRSGATQTSGNTLSSVSLLTHKSYHEAINKYEDRHREYVEDLHSLHRRSFPQWKFELSEAYSICLYGYGSKRKLMLDFADYLYKYSEGQAPITIFVNGHHPSLTLRSMLNTIASGVMPKSLLQKLPMQPADLAAVIIGYLIEDPPSNPVYILLQSLTAPVLVKPSTQSLLASLSSVPGVHLVATTDNPNFLLLWDSGLSEEFNWVFHDATTFESYDDGKGTGEIAGVVDSVHELMGRKGMGGKGREGVRWVLRSLPDNAKNLYRILLTEILTASADDFGKRPFNMSDGESDAEDMFGGRTQPQRSDEEMGEIDYKYLYQKAVEEFICSSEMAFRTLLKEFYDHQMVVSRYDGAGAETLGVPMRKEDLEGVLEDLME
jgi:origin recognition complex subunit 2